MEIRNCAKGVPSGEIGNWKLESIEKILEAVHEGTPLSEAEAMQLWGEAPLGRLMSHAHRVRERMHPGRKVGWIIDRNVNLTNVCMSMCSFCNFCRPKNSPDAFVLGWDDYQHKIDELFRLGGDQVLLQGGMHPDLGVDYYVQLFRELKSAYPSLKLHALGPPEIVHLANLAGKNVRDILQLLIAAGLDSLPGAGAEILSDRVRKKLSPKKCNTKEWLEVMREAHQLGLVTSATMMFGHIETPEERIHHLFLLRDLQDEKPADAPGFLSFIPWPFQDEDTVLKKRLGVTNSVTASEYVRLIALSRIILHNIQHIQASWLTVGRDVGMTCLHAGADDFGSIMIEEQVVSGAGAKHRMDADGLKAAITEAGFEPFRRNQRFELFDDE